MQAGSSVSSASSAPLISSNSSSRGVILIISSLLIWGFFPIYIKLFEQVTPLEILAHRVIWSGVFLLPLVIWKKQFRTLVKVLSNKRAMWKLTISALLIASNWLIYAWAVLNNHIMESSLGYFIGPLITILLGTIFLKERLNILQKISLALVATGVLVQIVTLKHGPWISLGLACSFAFYAFVRKQINVSATLGLTAETLILSPVALVYLLWLRDTNAMVFFSSMDISLKLISFGIFTAIPLLLYIAGARLLPLSQVGILQYLSPSMQFLIAVLVYHEPLPVSKIGSYSLIWSAIVLNSLSVLLRRRKLSRKKV